MTQIGGKESPLFALTPELLRRLDERIASGQLKEPVVIHRHGVSGGLVRFSSIDEAMVAKMAIV